MISPLLLPRPSPNQGPVVSALPGVGGRDPDTHPQDGDADGPPAREPGHEGAAPQVVGGGGGDPDDGHDDEQGEAGGHVGGEGLAADAAEEHVRAARRGCSRRATQRTTGT